MTKLSPPRDPLEALGEAYELLLEKTLQEAHKAKIKSGPALHQLIDEVADKSSEITELAGEKADQIREYFLAGVELQRQTVAFAEDAADEPAMLRLLDNHYRYVTAVVEGLVAEGIRRGEMKAVDPRIAAAVFTGAGEFLTRPAAGVLVDQPAVGE